MSVNSLLHIGFGEVRSGDGATKRDRVCRRSRVGMAERDRHVSIPISVHTTIARRCDDDTLATASALAAPYANERIRRKQIAISNCLSRIDALTRNRVVPKLWFSCRSETAELCMLQTRTLFRVMPENGIVRRLWFEEYTFAEAFHRAIQDVRDRGWTSCTLDFVAWARTSDDSALLDHTRTYVKLFEIEGTL